MQIFKLFPIIAVAFVLLSVRTMASPPSRAESVLRLPSATQIKDWAPKSPPKRLVGEQIYDYMDGAGEIPIACGYRSLTVAEYAGKSGGVLTLELYDMGSSYNAYGLYSMKRLTNGKVVTLEPKNINLQAQSGFQDILFHKGPYTCLLFGDSSGKVKDSDLLTFATAISREIKSDSALPDLLRYLPAPGYVPRTAKYFHGKAAMDTIKFVREDLFHLKSKPEALSATYANPSGRVLVIRYGSTSEATQVLKAAQKSTDTMSMAFVQRGNLLGCIWSLTGKKADPTLVDRLTQSLQKPGAMLEGEASPH